MLSCCWRRLLHRSWPPTGTGERPHYRGKERRAWRREICGCFSGRGRHGNHPSWRGELEFCPRYIKGHYVARRNHYRWGWLQQSERDRCERSFLMMFYHKGGGLLHPEDNKAPRVSTRHLLVAERLCVARSRRILSRTLQMDPTQITCQLLL